MRRLLPWALLALSLSANAVVAGIAVRRGAIAGAPREPPLFSRVSLDADQKARITALRERLLADREGQAARLTDLRAALARQLVEAPEDAAALDAALARIEGAQAAFQRRVVAHVLEVRATLRPEQRPAFEELVTAQLRGGMPFDPARASPGTGGAR